ncbi:MAG: hypothetical protein JXB04_12365 [Kiritimatiellae bacterium]|nr:hypothetical protein [Kiritimatiellia bacterium]
MRAVTWRAAVSLALVAFVCMSLTVLAGDNMKFKGINVTIGQWKQPVKEAPVKRVGARVRSLSGSNKTFINARFGRKGTTFENGRRVYLPPGQEMDVVWNVGGQMPGGQPLIINAYDGQVLLVTVVVDY